ncbi:helix-turn-helix domain-containing protein [Burkholderia sp. 22PA0099]|uniref:helix-turn-helix domain-containing protein n=1 Tax=Burkholderia sp. 22PA0099 TaxID=3237372 RepID=UPI0039C2B23C
MVTIDERQAFSDRLNLVLDDAGYPPKGSGRQNQLAKDWGLSQKGVRKWLEGEGVPETTRLVEMSKRYGVSFEWLATGRHPVSLAPSSEVVKATSVVPGPSPASEDAAQLVNAINVADTTGMPAEVFQSMSLMLKTIQNLRPQSEPRRLDINAPDLGAE